MEIIKDIAAILGVILSSASVITLFSKNLRTALSNTIRKYSNFEHSEATIGDIKTLLESHIKEDKAFRVQMLQTNEVTLEFTKTQCRNIIKNIFYTYSDTKILPLYEKKTLIGIEALYIGKLNCNSFAGFLLEEMKSWDIDYAGGLERENFED